MCVDGAGSFARDHGAYYIANGKRLGAFGLGFPLRGDGIRGLAGLSDQQGESIRAGDGIAVAIFAGVIHFHGNAREPLNHELARERGVPAGSTSRDIDFVCLAEILLADLHLFEEDLSGVLGDASQSGIAYGARLLIDFLEHEMLKAALFRLDRVPGYALDLP